jgi:ubiquinone/menaquinone biosynthesis C-methylase UbiE
MSSQRERIIEFFGKQSPMWSDNYNKSSFKQRLETFLEAMERAKCEGKKGGLLLDLGCGTGELSLLGQDQGFKVISLDISEEMLKRASIVLAKQGMKRKVVAGDCNRLPFRKGAFDLILCSSVYEYIDSEDTFWNEIRYVLSREGEILLSVPNKSSTLRKIERIVFRYGCLLSRIKMFRALAEKTKYLNIQTCQLSELEILDLLVKNGFIIRGMNFFGVPFFRLRGPFLSKKFAPMILVHACRAG